MIKNHFQKNKQSFKLYFLDTTPGSINFLLSTLNLGIFFSVFHERPEIFKTRAKKKVGRKKNVCQGPEGWPFSFRAALFFFTWKWARSQKTFFSGANIVHAFVWASATRSARFFLTVSTRFCMALMKSQICGTSYWPGPWYANPFTERLNPQTDSRNFSIFKKKGGGGAKQWQRSGKVEPLITFRAQLLTAYISRWFNANEVFSKAATVPFRFVINTTFYTNYSCFTRGFWLRMARKRD